GTQANPAYYIIWPDRDRPFTTRKLDNGTEIEVFKGKVLAQRDGKVNDIKDFIKFLETKPPEAPKPDNQVVQGLHWQQNFEPDWKEARASKVPVLIGYNSVNSDYNRFNEINVIPLPRIQKGLENYARVWLYTDMVPDEKLSRAEAGRMADRHAAWRESLG